ncbi:MAG: glutamate-1-semialdehyde 2,1-aminomutase [Planctomycetota bacterium]
MSTPTTTNAELFARAQRTIPGGVNSPVRAFGPVGGTPRFIVSGQGCRVVDAEGNSYIDYLGSWGPLILGHRPPVVEAAVAAALTQGTSFGAPTEREIELAELICEMLPHAEMARLVSSGTEATMTAIRLARGATGRDKIVKFEGCYHGHADSFLVAAGSGAATHGHPSSPGVPAALAELTLTAPFNDAAAVEALFAQHGPEIAAVIVEPIAGNIGLVPPVPGFLETLRSQATEHGAVLIFDEVMTGFRVHPQSAQGLCGVTPDLTTLGKIIGGGLPVGAIVGPRNLMEQLSPTGPIYQAGTLSGNPLSVAAGLAQLQELHKNSADIYATLERQAARLTEGVTAALSSKGIAHQMPRAGSMFALYFRAEPVRNFDDAKAADAELFRSYFHSLLASGVAVAPSPFEAGFVSTAHDDAAIDATVAAVGAWQPA